MMASFKKQLPVTAGLVAALFVAACSKQPGAAPESKPESVSTPGGHSETSGLLLPMEEMIKPWKGDFDGMAERRAIRALVIHNKMTYFIDRGKESGISYEAMKQFETFVNDRLKTKTLKVVVTFIPVPRDQLIPALLAGKGDIAAANLTITQGRQESVDFSDPFMTDVYELVVTGPNAPPIRSIDDLAGKEIQVRASSSYHESLRRINESCKRAGKQQMKLTAADEILEDDDILEMVNAGLIPITVVDNHKAEFWKQIFDRVNLHSDLVVNTGGQIAWAFRKDSPKLREVVNEFVRDHKKGTMFGNMMFKRYLANADWIKNSTSEEELKKFRAMVEIFKGYSGKYDFDWLMVAAQAYQESRLDQSLRSPAGAIGVMQIKPATAADPKVNIRDIEKLESNIHAGVKYLRFIVDEYFKDEKMDRVDKLLFAFASYNAGPAKVARLRNQATAMGLDPNKWFHNVEVVAAKEIGRETTQYVSNIYKYYIAYRQIAALTQTKHNRRKVLSAADANGTTEAGHRRGRG
jgi:membrane-bound lytic murein transglycosylase MltF